MKKLVLALLILLISSSGLAQDRYAVFLHGFQVSDPGSNDPECSEYAGSWINAGTPIDWVAADIIDDYLIFTYCMEDLLTETGQAALITRLATAMTSSEFSPNGTWVMVGHSMGGLVSRIGYDAIKNALPGLHIAAVLTVGTPHQGVHAARVAAPDLCGASTPVPPGYINVQYVFDNFRDGALEPMNDIHPIVTILISLIQPSALNAFDKAPEVFDDAFCGIKEWEQASIDGNVNQTIGIDGTVITHINSGNLLEPQHRRSVIGAEKRFVPVRAAAEMLDIDQNNEAKIVNNFNRIRDFYQLNRDVWHFQYRLANIFCIGCYGLCKACPEARRSKRKRNRWSRGKSVLDNIDHSWGQAIHSYHPMTVSEYQWVEVGTCGSDGNENGPGAPGLWGQEYMYINNTPQPGDSECIGGVLWAWLLVEYNIVVSTKNDALIGPDYAVWNPNDDPYDDSGPNRYYDDIPADGGYNHFELRRHKRAYTLPDVFQQGDPAPPMQEAGDWIRVEVFGGQ